MIKNGRLALLAAWLIVTPLVATRLWFAYPDSFPRLSDAMWARLISFYGSTNGEDLTNLEFIVVLAISFFATVLLTLVINGLSRLLRATNRSGT